MTDVHSPALGERKTIALAELELEVFSSGEASTLTICAAHPVDRFDAATAALIAAQTRTRVLCVNPRPLDAPMPPLATQVERIEAVRRALAIDSWIFWGMSGGGFLAQLYAKQFPQSLRGIVVESACLCFRERLRDAHCALSPFFPAWREPLGKLGLLPKSPADPARAIDFDAAADGEWLDVPGIGQVLRQRGGAAVLVSPAPISSAMKDAMPELLRFDARPWIRAVRTPALVLCGTADPIVPERSARAVAEAIAGSTFVAIAEAGHVPTAARHVEVAKAFANFAAWLLGTS